MNKYSLSKRLGMVADMIEVSDCHADIGCDHGFMALYLMNNNRINKAICTDINAGPLERAKEHIEKDGYSDKIKTILTDGLHNIDESFPHITSATICGMGGLMGVKILFDREDLFKKMEHFYLQLQSDLNLVRMYLEIAGYDIEEENVTKEEGKYYTAMKVKPYKEGLKFTSLDELVEYLKKEVNILSIEEAVKYYYPFYESMDKEAYEDFLNFMIDKYEKVIGQMKEDSNNYSEVYRELEIMKKARGIFEGKAC